MYVNEVGIPIRAAGEQKFLEALKVTRSFSGGVIHAPPPGGGLFVRVREAAVPAGSSAARAVHAGCGVPLPTTQKKKVAARQNKTVIFLLT